MRVRPDIRPLFPKPDEFRNRVAASEARNPVGGAEPTQEPGQSIPRDPGIAGRHFPGLFPGARIQPDHGIHQGLAGGIHRQDPEHLAREHHPRNAFRAELRSAPEIPGRRRNRAPPGIRILFGPSRLGMENLEGTSGAVAHLTGMRDQGDLDFGCADIHSQNISFTHLRSCSSADLDRRVAASPRGARNSP